VDLSLTQMHMCKTNVSNIVPSSQIIHSNVSMHTFTDLCETLEDETNTLEISHTIVTNLKYWMMKLHKKLPLYSDTFEMQMLIYPRCP